jgi:glycine cleavage system H lipoate-binding protein
VRRTRKIRTQVPLTLLPAKKYTADHEAVVFDDATGLGTVTITDYAQSSLGDVVFVELPSLGTKVAQGGAYLCFVISVLPGFIE